MKLYLAGASAEAEMVRDFAQLVESCGHVITMKWWEPVLANRAAGIPDSALSHEERVAHAKADRRAVRQADVFWLLVPSAQSTGAWVEFGVALERAGLVIVSGDYRRCIFADEADHRFASHADALKWLKSVSEPLDGADAFARRLGWNAPMDTIEPDASDEPSRGDRSEYTSLDEMVGGLGRAGKP